MAIYLMQHGKSVDKKIDPNRGLSTEGKEETILTAQTLLDKGITVKTIYHSGNLRAQQTAELIAKSLKVKQIERINGIDPLDDIIDFTMSFQFTDNIMIVGHLPFMEKLASYFITGHQDLTVVKFQNSAVICLNQNDKQSWHIKWTMMPKID